jgi:hypothetical protein
MPAARPEPPRAQPSRFAPDGGALLCQPGHWAYDTDVPWYQADALDEIAREWDLADGLAVLHKVTGRHHADLRACGREKIRQWWDECYAAAGHPASRSYRGYGDVVMYGSTGIFQIGAGAGEIHNVAGASRPPGRMMPGGPSR